MKSLVIGGAGYIGSFMTKRLLVERQEVVVLDSLERGHKEVVDKKARLIIGDIKNKPFLEKVFVEEKFDSILHFAGYISVEESTREPDKYFANNVQGTRNVLDAMVTSGTNKIIFSSSAAVYGNPTTIPIPEDHTKNPTSPYGENKLQVEELLSKYQKENGINFVALRYFNACGAALDGASGEDHKPETHIIPNTIRAAIENKPFTLFGTDYKTPDGTCVRDYIHVLDLVDAHVLALEKLQAYNGGNFYNVGTGVGHSNKEIVEMLKKISGKDFPVSYAERRLGDSDILVADPTRIKNDLGFSPQHSDLETIIKTAWSWHSQHQPIT